MLNELHHAVGHDQRSEGNPLRVDRNSRRDRYKGGNGRDGLGLT